MLRLRYTKEENKNDALNLSGMLHSLATLPFPTIALVHGAAFGGGVGLISACDIAVGVEAATFALSEVKLGLTPATISPYVVRYTYFFFFFKGVICTCFPFLDLDSLNQLCVLIILVLIVPLEQLVSVRLVDIF